MSLSRRQAVRACIYAKGYLAAASGDLLSFDTSDGAGVIAAGPEEARLVLEEFMDDFDITERELTVGYGDA